MWPVQRTRAVFDAVDAELLGDPGDGDGLTPLAWRCRCCGYLDATPAERMEGQARSSWLVCHACNMQRLHQSPQPLVRYYSTRGLRLLSSPAKDRGVPYDAICERCGTRRRVSVMTLTSGSPPCLRCDGHSLDPEAPHRVYLFAFDALTAYKVGITHCADDSRLRAHRGIGGALQEVVTMPDRATAVVLERLVLDRYRAAPAMSVSAHHFPHGGWTECWDMRAGHPSLAALAATLT